MPQTRVFRGASGALQMSPEAVRVAVVPHSFTATVTNARVGFVDVVRLQAAAFSARRTLSRVATFPVDDVRVIIVVHGSLRVRQDGRTNLVTADHATILRTGASYQYLIAPDSDVIAISLPRERLTWAAQRNLRLVSATIILNSMLLETILAFVRPVLAAARHSPEPSAGTSAAVLLSFVNSVVSAESDDDGSMTVQSMSTRSANAQLVASATILLLDHIRSPDLTAVVIASDLGVSVRNLYRAFELENLSVGELIRSTRLDMVAARLRTSGQDRSLKQLASDYGFGSTDVCARAFKARFCMSMSAYQSRRWPAPLAVPAADTA